MAIVHVQAETSALVSLVLSIVSFVSCSVVVITIIRAAKAKDSYHLQLVCRILSTDVAISLCIIFYFGVQYVLTTHQLRQFCKFYLPTVIYLFIVSYGWTIMIALRFRTLKNITMAKAWKPTIPFTTVWILPLLFTAPLFFITWLLRGVIKVHQNSEDTNQSCTFNHEKLNGIMMDLIFFQFPLVLTILINLYSYAKGIWALRNTPHSVIARQMRRAGGYLGVLLLVWIPNITYNFVSIFYGNNSSYGSFLDLVVFLSSLQGFLNVCVYVWSDPIMLKWLRNNIHQGIWRNAEGGDATTEEYAANDVQHNALLSAASDTDLETSFISEETSSNHEKTPSESSMSTRKSILVPNISSRRTTLTLADLDQEKFVRFGEISTHFISAASTPRASENMNFDDDTNNNNNDL